MRMPMQRSRTIVLAAAAASLAACGDSSVSPLITSSYTVTELMDGAPFDVVALNNAGQLVGRTNAQENVLVYQGATTDLGGCSPTGMNLQGTVSCVGGTVWRNGQVTSTTFPAGFTGSPSGVNDEGTVAGLGFYSSGSATTSCDGRTKMCAYIATPTRVTVIDLRASANSAELPRIDNGTDVVVFSSNSEGEPSGTIWKADSTSQPYSCAGLPPGSSLRAVGGDDEVVGLAPQSTNPTKTDAIVCRNGSMQSLGTLTSVANDISESGLIVGTTDDGHGFLWADGKLTILDQGLGMSDWHVVSADRVNDAGDIVVTASNGSASTATLLLTPITER